MGYHRLTTRAAGPPFANPARHNPRKIRWYVGGREFGLGSFEGRAVGESGFRGFLMGERWAGATFMGFSSGREVGRSGFRRFSMGEI